MGRIVFGRHQNPTGILVQPVNDPRPENASDSSQVAAVMQEGIDQGAGVVPRPRMNDHPGRFIDHQQVRILVLGWLGEGAPPGFPVSGAPEELRTSFPVFRRRPALVFFPPTFTWPCSINLLIWERERVFSCWERKTSSRCPASCDSMQKRSAGFILKCRPVGFFPGREKEKSCGFFFRDSFPDLLHLFPHRLRAGPYAFIQMAEIRPVDLGNVGADDQIGFFHLQPTQGAPADFIGPQNDPQTGGKVRIFIQLFGHIDGDDEVGPHASGGPGRNPVDPSPVDQFPLLNLMGGMIPGMAQLALTALRIEPFCKTTSWQDFRSRAATARGMAVSSRFLSSNRKLMFWVKFSSEIGACLVRDWE